MQGRSLFIIHKQLLYARTVVVNGISASNLFSVAVMNSCCYFCIVINSVVIGSFNYLTGFFIKNQRIGKTILCIIIYKDAENM